MIVLDSNVLSEMLRPRPSAVVAAWFASIPSEEAAMAATSVAELLYGARILPAGKRRAELSIRLARMFDDMEILPFDQRATEFYAVIAADRRAIGNPIGPFDCQIAATARAAGARIATRDVGGFIACGVEIVNPWVAQ